MYVGEKMENETLPKGEDGSELLISKNEKELEIEFKGKVWHFKYVELTWKEQTELIEMMREQKTDSRKGVTVTQDKMWKYMSMVYNKCVVGCPQGFLFDKCDPEFGQLLISKLPGIGSINPEEPDEDLKN